jgi:hypothetical protein
MSEIATESNKKLYMKAFITLLLGFSTVANVLGFKTIGLK